MPQPAPPRPSPAQLRKAYKQDLAAAWAWARRRHPEQTPYAFVLYGVEGGEPPRLTPCVLTEEGLTQVARRYLDGGYHDTLDEARAALRYSVADAPSVAELDGHTPAVDAVVAPFAKTLDDDAGYALLARAAIAALRELDDEALFGAGDQRERLLLIIVTEDTPKDWSTESARKLNPPAVFQRFEADTKIDGTYASSDAIAVAPDGRSLYSAGTRTIPAAEPGDHEFMSQVIAYDVVGPRLARRWNFEFPAFGDSVRALAASSESVYALRSKYVDNVCRSILARFPRDADRPAEQHQLTGEPAGLAMSPDGARLAVALHNKTLHLFDAALRPLGSRAFGSKIHAPCFLRSGDLLVPTEAAVLRVDPTGDAPAAVAAHLRAFRLAADAGNMLLAVSRWFALAGPERARPVEFGIHLLRLPSFDLLRTILIPGHQAVTPALSPDGRLIAFEAHEIGKPRRFVAVFDTATGREIARRKSNGARSLTFLPDSRTLVIGDSRFTTTEPIDLWVLPST